MLSLGVVYNLDMGTKNDLASLKPGVAGRQ